MKSVISFIFCLFCISLFPSFAQAETVAEESVAIPDALTPAVAAAGLTVDKLTNDERAFLLGQKVKSKRAMRRVVRNQRLVLLVEEIRFARFIESVRAADPLFAQPLMEERVSGWGEPKLDRQCLFSVVRNSPFGHIDRVYDGYSYQYSLYEVSDRTQPFPMLDDSGQKFINAVHSIVSKGCIRRNHQVYLNRLRLWKAVEKFVR